MHVEWNRAFSLLGSGESRIRAIEKKGVIVTRKQYIDFYLLILAKRKQTN
jgi:hypothetical protein